MKIFKKIIGSFLVLIPLWLAFLVAGFQNIVEVITMMMAVIVVVALWILGFYLLDVD